MRWNHYGNDLEFPTIDYRRLFSWCQCEKSFISRRHIKWLLNENSRRSSIENAIYIFKRCAYHASSREREIEWEHWKQKQSGEEFYQRAMERPVASMHILFFSYQWLVFVMRSFLVLLQHKFPLTHKKRTQCKFVRAQWGKSWQRDLHSFLGTACEPQLVSMSQTVNLQCRC